MCPLNPEAPPPAPTFEFTRELRSLEKETWSLPLEFRPRFNSILKKLQDMERRWDTHLATIQDSLSSLSLEMQCLAFDLEATRRERDAYRMRLEEETGE